MLKCSWQESNLFLKYTDQQIDRYKHNEIRRKFNIVINTENPSFEKKFIQQNVFCKRLEIQIEKIDDI